MPPSADQRARAPRDRCPRWLARFRVLLCALCVGALALLAAGQLVSDRTIWTQPVAWIPPEIPAGAALAFALLALTLTPRRARLLPCLLAALALLGTTHVLVVQWRLLTPRPDGARAYAIAHWNMTSPDGALWDRYLAGLPLADDPDVLLLTNALPHRRQALLDQTPGFEHARAGFRLSMLSKDPILEQRVFSLRLPRPEDYGRDDRPAEGPAQPRRTNSPGWFDPGRLMVATLGTRERLGFDLTVWFIDLPSDPRISRWTLARILERRLADIEPTLPTPHVLAGDFNIPRGSASLRRIVGAINPALVHARAGRGPAATWPRERPLLHIDHLYVAPPLRSLSYTLTDPGISEHLAQSAVLTLDPAAGVPVPLLGPDSP